MPKTTIQLDTSTRNKLKRIVKKSKKNKKRSNKVKNYNALIKKLLSESKRFN